MNMRLADVSLPRERPKTPLAYVPWKNERASSSIARKAKPVKQSSPKQKTSLTKCPFASPIPYEMIP